MGKKCAPSTFNIFRDSLSKNTKAINEIMVQNLPDMNLHQVDSDASGSDAEIVPLDFRTAIVKEGGSEKLVIQAKPIKYYTIEEEMDSVTRGKMKEQLESRQDPDTAIGSVEDYLAALRKDAFNVEEEDVVLIDPGVNSKRLYQEVDLPCMKEQRINNSLNAPKAQLMKSSKKQAQLEKQNENENFVKSLKDAQAKAAVIHQKQKAERLARMKDFGLLRSDANEEEAEIIGAPMVIPFEGQQLAEPTDLQFDDILRDMGLHDDVADILEEEEEKKIDCSPKSKNIEIVNSLMRDSKQKVDGQPKKTFTEDEVQKEMSRKFIAASQMDSEIPKPNDSDDSDVAPLPSIVDHAPKTKEEERVEKIQSASESARVASIEHQSQKRQ